MHGELEKLNCTITKSFFVIPCVDFSVESESVKKLLKMSKKKQHSLFWA